MADVSIENGVEIIGGAAFGNTALKSITIPSSVKEFTSVSNYGLNAFPACENLKSITVDSKNPVFHSDGNCIIDTAKKQIIAGCQSSVIPTDGSVTSIGDSAFYDCDELKNVTISENVTSIGYSAFSNCSGLKSVVIKDGVKEIGSYAFGWCSSLSDITLPDSVMSIGLKAFEYTAYSDDDSNWEHSVYNDTYIDALYIGNHLLQLKSSKGASKNSLPRIFAVREGTIDIADGIVCGDYPYATLPVASMTIPKSVKKIGSSYDVSDENFAINGYTGTAAEQFAKDRGYKFVSLDNHNHTFDKGAVTKKATCKSTGVMTYTCTVCCATKTKTLEKTGHQKKTVVDVKATLKANGKISEKCPVCGKVFKSKAISKIKTVKLSKTRCAYTGKAIAPKVTVKDAAGKVLTLGKDYTVKYVNNKKIGKATVVVTFKGDYEGTKTLSFKIIPAAPKATVTAGKKRAAVKWKAVKGAQSYTVYYSTSKNSGFKKAGTTAKTSFNVKKLKSGKTYYFKVVASKKVGKTAYNSLYSSVKKAKIK